MTNHARLGPSNERWPKCPGSVREEAAYPDTPGAAAIDGTGSHLLLEEAMNKCLDAAAFDGVIIGVDHPDHLSGWVVCSERSSRVQVCLDYIERRKIELGIEYPRAIITVESESRSDPGGMFGRDDWWGTVDITITVMRGDVCEFIEVIDYKDGRMWVHVPGNTQLISYLGGKIRPYVPEHVGGCRITIVQPKTRPPIRYEDVTPQYVVRMLEGLAAAAVLTDDYEAPLIPGDHCRWCKHKPNCNAESIQSLKTVDSMSNSEIVTESKNLFEYISTSMVDPTVLTVGKLSELADARAGIEAVFDRAEAEIMRRIEAGEPVPGYSLVPGNARQVYNVHDDEIAKLLKSRKFKKDEIYPAKLITPAQLMKSELSDDQKKSFKDKYITMVVPDKMRLKKVPHKPEADIKQMFGDVLQCNTTPSVFNDEPSFY